MAAGGMVAAGPAVEMLVTTEALVAAHPEVVAARPGQADLIAVRKETMAVKVVGMVAQTMQASRKLSTAARQQIVHRNRQPKS